MQNAMVLFKILLGLLGHWYRREPALAASIALLMSKSWYIHVCTLISLIYHLYTCLYYVHTCIWCTSGVMRSWTTKGRVSMSISMLSPVILHVPCHQFKCSGNGLHTQGTRKSLMCLPQQLQGSASTFHTASRLAMETSGFPLVLTRSSCLRTCVYL